MQHEEERVFYALERLWKDCPVIPFVDRDVERAAGRSSATLSAARRLVLLRHGRTADNAVGRIQGQLDTPLDEVGLQQADKAAGMLPALVPGAPALERPRPRPPHRPAAVRGHRPRRPRSTCGCASSTSVPGRA